MTATPNLDLPFIEGAQAQKHVTHNDALSRLDALVMLSAIDRDLSDPPASPQDGDRYLVKPPGAGAFAGADDRIAYYDGGGWSFFQPRPGWLCHVQDEDLLLVWDGGAWRGAVTSVQEAERFGLGTSADAINPFAAKLNNALWTAKTVAEGGAGDLRCKLNKEGAANTLSLLMQSGFSGRAELGLTGDDDFRLKVSPDGATWIEALRLDRNSGGAVCRDLAAGGRVQMSGDITPPQIAADQNDYDPPGLANAAVLRISSDAARAITGLAGGAPGRIAALVNIGSHAITLAHANPASIAADRFELGSDVAIAPSRSALICYDANDSRWRLLALS